MSREMPKEIFRDTIHFQIREIILPNTGDKMNKNFSVAGLFKGRLSEKNCRGFVPKADAGSVRNPQEVLNA